MKYRDLREFLAGLEQAGDLLRVREPVSTRLEMTALSDFALRKAGPVLFFENVPGYKISTLTNLFGTPQRVAAGMGAPGVEGMREIGRLLASLKEPEPPKGARDAGRLLQMGKALWDMRPSRVQTAACQEVVFEGDDIDLGILPVQVCWPDDAGPLITWRGPMTCCR